jgi:predicted GIY-YIG superfamily endonuclease
VVHYIYIVRCKDGTLYTGYAIDPERRVEQHNAGRGAKYTAGRRPVRLVYTEVLDSRGAALSRERQVKGLTRGKKQALVASRRSRPVKP